MCQLLSELRSAMGGYAADFDAGLYSVGDCERIVEHAAAVEKMAAAVKAEAAARVAATSRWRECGARSPADYLARRRGTTRAQAESRNTPRSESGSGRRPDCVLPRRAADALNTARRLRHLPRARAAARAGELSPAQASAIAGAAAADPSAEERLVEKASRSSLQGLRDDCAAPRRRPTTPRPPAGASTPGASCAATPTPRAPSTCTCTTRPRPGRS